MGHTLRAWDPRPLQSMLNGPLYFGPLNSLVPKCFRPFWILFSVTGVSGLTRYLLHILSTLVGIALSERWPYGYARTEYLTL